MTLEDCHCGHPRSVHRRLSKGRRGACQRLTDDEGFDVQGFSRGHPCPCGGFDNSRIPAPGERLVFGEHRQVQEDAETAPAWPPLA